MHFGVFGRDMFQGNIWYKHCPEVDAVVIDGNSMKAYDCG